MEITLESNAEKNAEKAESLKAFSGIKLLHIKKQVVALLGQIGKNGIFEEYTKHDISHINEMLHLLDHIIPSSTKEKMTHADWLLIVLSIYFHDLGMLVTKEEFKNRKNSKFKEYRDDILLGKYGEDYKDKIEALEVEEQDKFIYQELVRKNHGERIKYWLLNEKRTDFHLDQKMIDEIQKLISNVNSLFLNDLASICESHQLSDLENFDKYKISQPYGTTIQEEANVFYAALLLRTADLLHITSDRTPSIEYVVINPTDPISVEEWAKQKSVNNIRPQKKKNSEGEIDDDLPKDTFEVTALFEKETGYFSLISYINYARKELLNSYNLNEKAKKYYASTYDFPWKNIDDSKIQAKDFEKRQFVFILDQNKILDLLVGHTLYNDSTVVLREFTQNAIDATRLKKYDYDLGNEKHDYSPEIHIEWDKKNRNLFFIDNGTGMDLDIIQNHLLKVGSSRYQDANFKRKYPNFTSISRFGIGLLTGFLIADDIDILTKTENMDKPILLKIRKVHGKYLLKYGTDDPNHLLKTNSGTSIRLYVRSSVKLDNIEIDLKKWILFPAAELTLHYDGKDINIGYDDPKSYLVNFLQKKGYAIDDEHYKVIQYESNGVILSFALEYEKFLGEWRFVDYNLDDESRELPTGLCIEGIRIDSMTPGFDGISIMALANSTGKFAPKTNVARSNIELTPEREKLISIIYEQYLKFIIEQYQDLKKQYSISWSSNEVNWMLDSFASTNNNYRHREHTDLLEINIFRSVLRDFPAILIEKDHQRKVVTFNELERLNHYWTIECASYTSADNIIREIKSAKTSALSIMNSLYEDTSQTDHVDILMCSNQHNWHIEQMLQNKFQVTDIKLISDQRRLDLSWGVETERKWFVTNYFEDDNYSYQYNARIPYREERSKHVFIQLDDINISGVTNEIAIKSSYGLFILKGNPLHDYILDVKKLLLEDTREHKYILDRIIALSQHLLQQERSINLDSIDKLIERIFDKNESPLLYDKIWDNINKSDLINMISTTNFEQYDVSRWYRYSFISY